MAHFQTYPKVEITEVTVQFKGKKVSARKLRVYSEIPMNINRVWNNVKKPQLLQFLASGMISFKSVDGELPREWQVGKTYRVKMRVFGLIPFGGIHYLFVEKINEENYKIFTREWDNVAKVWNHQIAIRDLGSNNTYYEDSIIIYGGMVTGFITLFAKRFYIHRQKRWQKVAKENREF